MPRPRSGPALSLPREALFPARSIESPGPGKRSMGIPGNTKKIFLVFIDNTFIIEYHYFKTNIIIGGFEDGNTSFAKKNHRRISGAGMRGHLSKLEEPKTRAKIF
jgi:hypothetical protein